MHRAGFSLLSLLGHPDLGCRFPLVASIEVLLLRVGRYWVRSWLKAKDKNLQSSPLAPPRACFQSLLMKIDAFHYVQLGTAYRLVSGPPSIYPCSYPVLLPGLRLRVSVPPLTPNSGVSSPCQMMK